MDATAGGLLVVLSADQTWAQRLLRFTRPYEQLRVEYVSDPVRLPRLISDTRRGDERIIGLVLDLAYPDLGTRQQRAPAGGDEMDLRHAREEAITAWCLELLLATRSLLHAHPLLVISANPQLERVFRAYGLREAEIVSPCADDAVWQRHLAWCLAVAERVRDTQRRSMPTLDETRSRSSDALHVAPDTWIDLARGYLVRQGRRVRLTGREVRVLDVLAHAPGRFHQAQDIARQVAISSHDVVDEHCIEQTISRLRHKLGEHARDPRILVSQRGLGYALTVRALVPA